MTVDPRSEPVRSGSAVDDVVRLPRTIAALVVETVRWMIAEPVQEGRIRMRGRTWGVRAFALAAISTAIVGTVVPLLARTIRSDERLSVVVDDLGTSSFPRSVLWVPVVMLVISTTLMATAALHTAVWVRVVVFVVNSLMLLFVGTSDVTEGMSTGVWTALGGVVALAVLQMVRWRSRPVWWEGVVALGVVTTVFAVALHRSAVQSAAFGLDRLPLTLEGLLRVAQFLPYAMLVVAGVAVAKVALSGVTLVAEFGSRRLSAPTFLGLALALVLFRTGTSAWRWVDDITDDAGAALRSAAGAGVMVGAVVLAWWTMHHTMRRSEAAARRAAVESRRAERSIDREVHGDVDGDEWWEDDAGELRQSSGIEDVVNGLDSVAVPIAIALSLKAVPLLISIFAQQIAFALWRDNAVTRAAERSVDWLNEYSTVMGLRIVGGLALLGGGWLLAGRGRRGAAEMVACSGAVLLAREVMADGSWLGSLAPSPVVIDRLGVVVVAGLVAVWVWRRHFTAERQAAVVLLLLASSLIASRDFISNPVTRLVGSAGLGAAMFGLMWNLFTEAGATNTDSDRYPRDSRLMLFLAQVIFGVTIMFWIALSRQVSDTYALTAATVEGDAVIGVALLLVAGITILHMTVTSAATPAPLTASGAGSATEAVR